MDKHHNQSFHLVITSFPNSGLTSRHSVKTKDKNQLTPPSLCQKTAPCLLVATTD